MRHRSVAAVAATAWIGVLPLGFARYLPIQDLPNVLAIVATLGRASTPAFARSFEVEWTAGPYTGFYALAFLLAKLVGADGAVRTMVALPMLLIPSGLAVLGGRLRARGELAGLLAIPLLYSDVYFVGFHPFLWGLLLVVLAAIALHAWLTSGHGWQLALLGVLTSSAWLMHPSALMILGGIGGVTVLAVPLERRRIVFACAALLPALLLSIRFFDGTANFDPTSPGIELATWDELRYTALMPAFSLVSQTSLPRALGIVAAGVFAVVCFGGALAARGEPNPRLRWVVPLGLFGLSLVLPFAVGPVVWLDSRVALVAWLSLGLMAAPPPRVAPAARIAAGAVVGVTLASVLATHVAFDRSTRALDPLFARMGEGARVVGLAFSRTSEPFVPLYVQEATVPTFSLHAHMAALYHLEHGGSSPWMTFHPSLRWIPLRLRDPRIGARFPIVGPFVPKRVLRGLVQDASGVDFVLVRRMRPEHVGPLEVFADHVASSRELDLFRVRVPRSGSHDSPVP